MAVMVAAGTMLAACGATGPGEAAVSNEATTSAETVSDGSQPISTAGHADLSDGLITCTMRDYDGKSGLTTTQPFILIDGQVKRYSQFQNAAFDLCQPGQEGCSFQLKDGVIEMTYTSPKGVGSRYRVDLSTMEIEAWETLPGEAERAISFAPDATCARTPLPEGLKLN